MLYQKSFENEIRHIIIQQNDQKLYRVVHSCDKEFVVEFYHEKTSRDLGSGFVVVQY